MVTFWNGFWMGPPKTEDSVQIPFWLTNPSNFPPNWFCLVRSDSWMVAIFTFSRLQWGFNKTVHRPTPTTTRGIQQTLGCQLEVDQGDGTQRKRAIWCFRDLSPPRLGNLVHTFDFLYKRTHLRRWNAHKNMKFSKFLMHLSYPNFKHFQDLPILQLLA